MRKKTLVFWLICFSFFLLAAKPKLAVMSVDDQSGKMTEKIKEAATTLLRMNLSSSGEFIVIDEGRQQKVLKSIIKEKKKESYQKCYDEKCQIPLGQALSADTILRTTVTELGGVFLLGVELVDLAKEASIKAANAEFDGTEKGILAAVKKVVNDIIVKSVEEAKRLKEQEKKEKAAAKKVQEEKKRKEMEQKLKKEREMKLAREKKIKELQLAYKKDMKVVRKGRMVATWTTLATGLALSASGVGLLIYSDKMNDEWQESYGNYLDAANETEAVKYRNETEDLRDKEKISKILGGVFLGTGIGFLFTSIITASVSSSAEKKVKKKYKLSFQVDPFSRMAVFSVNY